MIYCRFAKNNVIKMISAIKYNSYIIYYIRTRDSKNFQFYFLLNFLRSKTKKQTLKEHDFFYIQN